MLAPAQSTDIARPTLKALYSASQFFSDGLSLGLSIYTQFNTLPAALIIGTISGSLSAVTTWGFKGPVIDKSFGKDDSDKDEIWFSESTAKAACWFYTLLRMVQEFGMNYFIFDSVLAFLSSLNQQKNLHLSAMSPLALLVLSAYTLMVNIPFILSNEIYETCGQIMEKAGVTGAIPTIDLIRPLQYFKNYISSVGAVTHSLEHLTNLILLIPPTWFLTLFQLTNIYMLLGAAGVATVAGILFFVHLVQTYFFEGRHTLMNLNAIDKPLAEEQKVHQIESVGEYWALKISNKLLDTQSLFHAADDARFVLVALLALGFDQGAHLLAALQFTIVCLGIQFSSIYESKQATQEAITHYENKGMSI